MSVERACHTQTKFDAFGVGMFSLSLSLKCMFVCELLCRVSQLMSWKNIFRSLNILDAFQQQEQKKQQQKNNKTNNNKQCSHIIMLYLICLFASIWKWVEHAFGHLLFNEHANYCYQFYTVPATTVFRFFSFFFFLLSFFLHLWGVSFPHANHRA